MSYTRRLYVDGLENHIDLLQQVKCISQLSKEVELRDFSGNEELADTVMEAAKDLGSGAFTVAMWVGGKTISGISAAVGGLGDILIKTFGDNQTLIQRVLHEINGKEEIKVTLSKSAAGIVTAEGSAADLSHDMDVLLETLKLLVKHCSDVNEHVDKQLLTARKLKDVSKADDILKLIDEFEALKYPVFELPEHRGNKRESKTLPGGKVWTFDLEDGKPSYLMHGDAPAESGSTLTLSKSEVSSLMVKLDKVNSMHKQLKQAYDGYLDSLKGWGEMVKTVEVNLGKLERVSKTILSQANKLLAGDTDALAFYSGFTPRAVSYADRYIHGVLGVFA